MLLQLGDILSSVKEVVRDSMSGTNRKEPQVQLMLGRAVTDVVPIILLAVPEELPTAARSLMQAMVGISSGTAKRIMGTTCDRAPPNISCAWDSVPFVRDIVPLPDSLTSEIVSSSCSSIYAVQLHISSSGI